MTAFGDGFDAPLRGSRPLSIINSDSPSATRFGAVKRNISVLKEGLGGRPVIRSKGDPDAGADCDLKAKHLAQKVDGSEEAAGEFLCLQRVRDTTLDHGELIAAQSSDQIPFADHFFQRFESLGIVRRLPGMN